MAFEEEQKKSRGQKFKEGWSNFCTFLYNGENKTVMGRGGKSWAKIGVFYIILYSFLAGFFAAMLAVFMTTVNPAGNVGKENAGPKLTQYIVNSPGLTLVKDPIEPSDKFDRETEVKAYKDAIDAYLKAFEKIGSNLNVCPIREDGWDSDGEEACQFRRDLLASCASGDYGYGRVNGSNPVVDAPCVFVKLNKIWGWVPAKDGSNYLKLDCSAEGGKATVDVMPEGYLKSAFPFLGGKEYQYPAVAVKVKDVSEKTLVQCTLKGEGIEVSSSFNPERSYGKIEFEVQPLTS